MEVYVVVSGVGGVCVSNTWKWKRVCCVNGKRKRVAKRKVRCMCPAQRSDVLWCHEKESGGVCVSCKGNWSVCVVLKEREGV